MSAPVSSTLRTRRPLSPRAVVRRRRLEVELDRAFESTLTVVSAGPGFGKTVTVASWVELRQVDHAFAWLTPDQSDDSPQTFWSDVLAAIRTSGAVPIGSALTEIAPASVFGAREVDAMLSRFDDLRRPVVLVLDDFHVVRNPAVLDTVGALLEHPSPRLRLVLTTRSDPVLPLHRLRVAGRLSEIRSRDLAFTREEAAELFAVEGFDLLPDQVAHLHRRTQGWPAGLRLAAMTLDRDDLAGSIQRVTGSGRAIAEYLIGEVLTRLDPADREFMLRTSVVDRLCAELADRLTDRTDGQQVIDRLVASNSFVTSLEDGSPADSSPQDGDEWVSYHPLLRELLRHRLLLERATLVPELNRRVAAWLGERGEHIQSIRYRIRADDWDGAGRALLTCVPRILSVDAPALAAAIEPMVERAQTDPGLYELLAANVYHVQRHEFAAMRQDTLEGRQYLDDAPPELRPTVAVLLDLLDMVYFRMSGDAGRLVELSRAVLRVLDGTPRREIPLARHFRAVTTSNLGVGQVWTEGLDAAERTFADAEGQLADLGMELSVVNTVAYQSVLEAMAGRCRQAERLARQGLDLVERRGWGSEFQSLGLYLGLGLVLNTRGQADLAVRAFGRGLAAGGPQTDRMIRLGLAVGSVEAAVLRSDIAAALAADARVRLGLSRTPAVPIRVRRWAAAAGASALIAAGLPAEAIDRLGEPGDDRGFSTAWQRVWLARGHLDMGELADVHQLLESFTESGWQYREPVVAARLLLAVTAERQRRDGAALTHLTAAVDLAHPEGIRRPFLQLADRLTGLLHHYQVLDGSHSAFVAEVIGTGSEADGGEPVEHLTEREMTVLKYLPTMLKAGEIADDLFVSVNTIKAHLRSIYRKLGVPSRREAVERARILGLL